jgi:hypothetical protein
MSVLYPISTQDKAHVLNEGNQVKEMGKGWVQISFLFSHDLMMKDIYYSHN